jgi:hypothetical protein
MLVSLVAAMVLLSSGSRPAFGWGLVAHRVVTESAAEHMPSGLASFFGRESARLQEMSVEPDTVLKREEPGREEKRHFINIDALDTFPFEGVPVPYAEAASLFGETKLRKQGTLPWRIASVLDDLRGAMRRKDAAGIVRQAGYLSHYVADLFQPLHLTKNFDGQLTCNAGIHHAFESEMIERSSSRYRTAVMESRVVAATVERPGETVFRWIRETYPLVERILEADHEAMKALKDDGKDYYQELDKLAGPIVERQLSAAAAAVASLWYTAWVQAGKPAMPAQ